MMLARLAFGTVQDTKDKSMERLSVLLLSVACTDGTIDRFLKKSAAADEPFRVCSD